MASKNTQKFTRTGAAPTLAAVDGAGDSFPLGSSNQKFHFKNTDVAGRTVTFVAQRPCNQGVLHNAVVSVPAATERIFDGFGSEFQDNNGRIQLTYDAATGLTVASYV